MSRTFGARWRNVTSSNPIKLAFIDDGITTLPVQKILNQLYYLAGFYNAIGIPMQYIGPVSSDTEEPSVIYTRFVEATSEDDFYAWTAPRTEFGTRYTGGVLNYRANKVDELYKFGLSTHELFHNFGGAHHNGVMSIMNNDPYLNAAWQATLKQEDYITLNSLFPGVFKFWPMMFETEDVIHFHIPGIIYQDSDVTMHGIAFRDTDSDRWYLEISGDDIVPSTHFSGNFTCWIEGATWYIPFPGPVCQLGVFTKVDSIPSNTIRLRLDRIDEFDPQTLFS